jgi:cyclopropane fatty-acyl-phospholipid synthase-like methyltransferase
MLIQAVYAAAMSKRMGIQDHRTTFWCMDYRDIPTNVGVQYDKVSCIEMAEHVGIKNFQAFLKQVWALLKDDCTFLLQIAGLRRAFQVSLLSPIRWRFCHDHSLFFDTV